MIGLEPITCWLQISCSANWATSAYIFISWFVISCSACDQLTSFVDLSELSHIGVYYIYLSDYSDKRTLFWESFSVTPTGIEPVLPPWKGDVLTAWPRSHFLSYHIVQKNSPSRARTYNPSVNSRVLYHWAIEDYFHQILSELWMHCTFKTTHWKIFTSGDNSSFLPSWISPRPISISQLHALLHFHLWPINLVVFKGS